MQFNNRVLRHLDWRFDRAGKSQLRDQLKASTLSAATATKASLRSQLLLARDVPRFGLGEHGLSRPPGFSRHAARLGATRPNSE
jgi:hypothetical protein